MDSNLQYRGKIGSSFEALVALGEGRVPAMPRGPHTHLSGRAEPCDPKDEGSRGR